ncbi:MAG: CocE/NonD family hydrolase, partial [Pseudomonadota bacterium]
MHAIAQQMIRKLVPVGAGLAMALLLAACGSSSSPTNNGVSGAKGQWVDYNPPALYSGTKTTSDQFITMRDGVRLAVDVTQPLDANGQVVSTPLPVILTMTGYNKGIGTFVPAIGGASPYFVEHGYIQVIVDVRGTGHSGGEWEAFGETEQADYDEILDWVVEQPWSNGRIGLHGASLLGITAVLAASRQHPAVKALFPIVPMADSYRDIVFAGGQTNVGFI